MDGTQRPTKTADSRSPLNQSVSEKIRESNAEPMSRMSAVVSFFNMVAELKRLFNFSNYMLNINKDFDFLFCTTNIFHIFSRS